MSYIVDYWWVIIPIILLISYKLIFRLFGIIIIPEDKIGLVTKKFVLFGANKELPAGRIIAIDGEAGFQAQPLAQEFIFGNGFGNMKLLNSRLLLFQKGKLV
jgi:hypothetical protein